MSSKIFSVIIVNYNGKNYLKNCINSILKNSYDDYEIIIADNNSTDGSVSFIENEFSASLDRIRFIKLDKNYGPAKARNEAAKIARGVYLGFLDNDTEVDPDWMTNAVKYFKDDMNVGILQCKLLMLKNKKQFDYAGEYLSSLGFLVHRASFREEDRGQYDAPEDILAAKSAGMFIRKDVFEKIGGFDEDYFIFVEETDLGWRCWLAGYRVIFAYDSVVYHHFSSTKNIVDPSFNNYLIRFHGTKNYILTLYKNLSLGKLLYMLPRHIILWFGLATFLLIRGKFDSSINITRGILWNIRNYTKNSSKRKRVQGSRVITDKELFAKICRKKSVLSYIKNYFSSQKLLTTPEN
jgi:GT2 family glycosyltransferase